MNTLIVSERENRKPNQLRDAGITPIALVQHGEPTRKMQAPSATLMAALAKAHDARVIELQVEGESAKRICFIKQIDRRPFTPQILTVTLNQVTLTELMTVEVPVIATGTPKAVLLGTGVLVNTTSTIRIRGNYTNLPPSIEVDTSELAPNGNIHAGDIKLPEGTELDCPADTTLFTVQTLRGAKLPDPETPAA